MSNKEIVTAKWLSKMAFEADVNGYKVLIDAESNVGGEDHGPRPKPFMLLPLGGCTGMDLISMPPAAGKEHAGNVW